MSDDFREHGHAPSLEDSAIERLPADLEATYDRLAKDSEGWARRLPAAAALQDFLRALSTEETGVAPAAHPIGTAAGSQEQDTRRHAQPERPVPGRHLLVAERSPSRRAVWGGALSAVAVVMLLAVTFVLLPHTHGTTGRAGATATTSPRIDTCPPDTITLTLPAHTELYQLTMTSPTEGWALGHLVSQGASGGQIRNPVLERFHQCRWAPVPNPLAGEDADLNNISMATATDGWAAGVEAYGASWRCVLLHYTAGQWQRAALPPQIQSQGWSSCDQVRMSSPDEGWLLAQWGGSAEGPFQHEHVLHYVNGVWTQVASPISGLFDLETTGPDDVWVGGLRPPAQTDPNRVEMIDLAHYTHGHWTTFHLAVGGQAWIRMNSPSDGWLVSATTPIQVLHYDGSTWQQTPLSNLRSVNGSIDVFDASDVWTITYGLAPNRYPRVTSMRHDVDGQWHTVTWPFPDDFVLTPLTRTAPGDYWAVGVHEDGTDQSTRKWVLLQYVDGAWHEYGA